MKINKNFSSKEWSPKPHPNDLIGALEAIENREKVHIKVTIPYKAAEKLKQFLKEKGILGSQGILLLIQHGLSNESEEELESLKNEMKSKAAQNLWGEYAVMKFRTYEYFMENKVMTMKLSSMLYENKSLKRTLKTKGLQKFISEDEWDNWNKLKIDGFYRKYVFTSHL
ncbi:MAG: hypothetical protein QXQ94_00110 [Candidatus Bathyarchaeia archaeon]